MMDYRDGEVLTVERIEADRAAFLQEANRRRMERFQLPLPDEPDMRWTEFKRLMQEADEIRWFCHVQGPRSAQMGYELRRGASIQARFIVALA